MQLAEELNDRALLMWGHNCVGTALNMLGEYRRSLRHHEDALKLYEETVPLQQAKLGRHHPKTLDTMYNLACVHARLIPKSSEREKHAELAMDWLQQAIAAGYKDVDLMKRDTDLDPLRDRADFKKLLAKVEAVSKKK